MLMFGILFYFSNYICLIFVFRFLFSVDIEYSLLSPKVVKIVSELIKSYDFRSQYILNVQNRFQNSKIDKIGLKLSKISKIK
jgi:hypothetical protein